MIAAKTRKPLFVDLRDITEQWGNTSYMVNSILQIGKIGQWLTNLYIRKTNKQRNHILHHAATVTTISRWHQELLLQYNPGTQLIYNGYDPDIYTFQPKATSLFTISIAELKKQKLIANTKIIFHIETEMINPLVSLVKQYHIDDICSISGYIPRDEALQLLQYSGISLIFNETKETNTTHGIMTTKFYEALGCEKPILCTPSDSEELAQTIRQTNAGLASSNINEIKAFILDKYHEWQQNGFTHQAVINKEQFSREKQAEQFEQLFLKY